MVISGAANSLMLVFAGSSRMLVATVFIAAASSTVPCLHVVEKSVCRVLCAASGCFYCIRAGIASLAQGLSTQGTAANAVGTWIHSRLLIMRL
jgi:hypothetical protein